MTDGPDVPWEETECSHDFAIIERWPFSNVLECKKCGFRWIQDLRSDRD